MKVAGKLSAVALFAMVLLVFPVDIEAILKWLSVPFVALGFVVIGVGLLIGLIAYLLH